MSPEDPVLIALRSLAESDRGREAPPEVEERLRLAFREKRREFARRRAGLWAGAAAAVVVIAAAVVIVFARAHASNALLSPEPARAVANAPTAPKALQESRAASIPVPVARRTATRGAGTRLGTQPREIVTEFFPLIDVAPPFERGELVRVNVSAAAMRTVGLPVSEDHLADRVQADVLVGEEGLPRAIRFVKVLN
jgi:hypothetical protein